MKLITYFDAVATPLQKTATPYNFSNPLFWIYKRYRSIILVLKIYEFNIYIFPNYKYQTLQINRTKTNEFSTENDEGTGTNFKDLILFDLAVLALNEVPALAHDSVTIKNIDNPITVNIYKTYETFKTKQIFTVIDKVKNYEDKELQKIVYKYRVLKLSFDGNELFGRSQAKKANKKDKYIASYNKLWKLLIDKNMSKHELMELTGLSSSSLAKLKKGANITTDVLCKICKALDCDFKDIMEYIPR